MLPFINISSGTDLINITQGSRLTGYTGYTGVPNFSIEVHQHFILGVTE